MHWKELVPECFGSEDFIFGSHEIEDAQARKMLKKAIDEKATMKDIIGEVEKYLLSNKVLSEYIEDELEKIRTLDF